MTTCSCLCTFILVLTISTVTQPALAASGDGARMGALFGVAQAASNSSDGRSSVAEGPLGFGFMIDYPWQDSFFVMAEHLRSFGEGSSSVGLSGFGMKYYPWLNPLHAQPQYNYTLDRSTTSIQGNAVFFGFILGLAQASVPAEGRIPATVAVGPFFDLKAGTDYSLTRHWGLRAQADVAMTLGGSGTVQYFATLLGTIYIF